MARPNAKATAGRYHISGQSIVTIGGTDFYLGNHNSPESIARYASLIAIYQQNGLSLPEGFDLAELDPQVALILGGVPIVQNQSRKAATVRQVVALFREHMKGK